MKICQVIDLVNVGGAGITAKRISNVLSDYFEHEIVEVSSSPSNDNSKNYALHNSRKLQFLCLFSRFLNTTCFRKLWSLDLKLQFSRILEIEKPNIINFHNIHSASWPIDLIKTALKFTPVVWTLHDCWGFSATYYPTYCPSPDRSQERKISDFWQTINQLGNNQRLSAITPSKWLQDQALASKWEGRKVVSIHNPIPDFFFEQQDRTACKRALGLSDDKTIILCIAGNLSEERKGGQILKQILQSSKIENVQFLLVGENADDCVSLPNIRNLGFVSDDITLRIAYHAADLLLHPAPVDNLPNTVAESMSCGTPVLAFNTGGLPEMVKPEKSGWLVDTIDAKAMVAKLDAIVVSRSCECLRKSTKSHAKSLFDSASVGKSYLQHFHSMMENP